MSETFANCTATSALRTGDITDCDRVSLRMQCLEIASRHYSHHDEAVVAAREMYAFVMGEKDAG